MLREANITSLTSDKVFFQNYSVTLDEINYLPELQRNKCLRNLRFIDGPAVCVIFGGLLLGASRQMKI